MPGKQGKRLMQEEIIRVQYLLAETELTPRQIAIRMGVSSSSILSINRRAKIRHYNGKRSRWEKGLAVDSQAATPNL